MNTAYKDYIEKAAGGLLAEHGLSVAQLASALDSSVLPEPTTCTYAEAFHDYITHYLSCPESLESLDVDVERLVAVNGANAADILTGELADDFSLFLGNEDWYDWNESLRECADRLGFDAGLDD